MRLFCIYNRGYNLRYVIAENIEQALDIAFKAGHIRRPGQFRRWVDCTEDPPAGMTLAKLLDEGRPGILLQTERGWQLSS